MDYQAMYQQKLTTAEEAVKVVRSGDWVDYTWCTNHPIALDKALAARRDELTDVKVRGGVTMWMPEIAKAEDAGDHFTWHSWHCSGIDRKIITKGMGYFSPMRYSELPRFYRENLAPVDVVMLQTTPMDAHGNFNFGLAASHLADLMSRAKCIIVEVNENMPWVYGLTGTEINIQDVTYVVEGDNPPVAQLGAGGEPTDVDRAVANLVVPQIPNGACLQLGIGGMPNTIGAMIAQSDLKDLSVHTEMYVDGFVDMAAAGKITGRHKALDKGRQVFAFAAGSQKLYDYVDRNPDVMGAPVDYTNDVRVIAQIDNFISINNAIDIDLFGQINAESAGIKHISGTGGQLDFAMGAYLSNGVCPCIKHMPGHGRAETDPHLGLPVLNNALPELAKDFYPFTENNDCPAGMTAHIVVSAVDDRLPVTLSKKAIDYLIRGLINFNGLLISDAIDMKALNGSVGEKAAAVIAAGCDLVCYCGGKSEDLAMLAENCPQASDRTLERLQTVYEVIARPDKTLDTVLTDRYYRAVGLVEEYDETYDATEVLNRMQKGNDAR